VLDEIKEHGCSKVFNMITSKLKPGDQVLTRDSKEFARLSQFVASEVELLELRELFYSLEGGEVAVGQGQDLGLSIVHLELVYLQLLVHKAQRNVHP
jgi:hypothetical protein